MAKSSDIPTLPQLRAMRPASAPRNSSRAASASAARQAPTISSCFCWASAGALCRHDYSGFADYAMQERQETQFPPFCHLALLRAKSPERGNALAFLARARAIADGMELARGG